MTTDEAYIEGFVKRAAEYGFSEVEAVEILKRAAEKAAVDQDAVMQPNQKPYTAPPAPERAVPAAPPVGVPAVSLDKLDSRKNKLPFKK